MPPTDHSVLSASSAYRWMRCPGSVRLSEGLPAVQTDYMREGTEAHAVAEAILRGHPYKSTPEMATHVRVFTDYVRELEELYQTPPMIETRVSLAPLRPPVDMFGTADVIFLCPTRLHVVDFKYGQGVVVEVDDNVQLLYYLLAALVSTPRALRNGLTSFVATIVQPRAEHRLGPIRTVEYTRTELDQFMRSVIEAAKATMNPSAPLVPGDWCHFCPAAGHCPALEQQSKHLAQSEFTLPAVVPPSPELLPLARVAEILAVAPQIEKWLGALRQRVQQALEAGESVPGFKLVLKRGQREWNNVEEVEEWAKYVGLKSPELHHVTLLSPAQLEALVGKSNVPKQLWTLVSSGTTVAPDSDARPALPGLAQQEFAADPVISEDS